MTNKYSYLHKRAEDDDSDFGEVAVSEYIILLFAVDTYFRYLDEVGSPMDTVGQRGLQIIKALDVLHLDNVSGFLSDNLPGPSQKKMLARALALRPTPEGLSRRALGVRTVLSRGGAQTMRAVFVTNKALLNVRTAISASMMDNSDAALDKFDAIQVKNPKIRNWIDLAAKTAGSGEAPAPVEAATKGGISDDTTALTNARMESQSAAVTSTDVKAKDMEAGEILQRVQDEATEVAKKVIDAKMESDEAPSRSEVVGIATAAAVSALSDPTREENVPEPLRSLDPEQRGAALQDGRTLVSAGAGSGKTSTVVARMAYLVKTRKVNPSRILCTSFNTKAASELKNRIGNKVGGQALSQMNVGTMHSLFRRFIGEYGTREQRIAIGMGDRSKGDPDGFMGTGATIAGAVNRAWKQCYKGDAPTLKKVNLLRSKWVGNGITPSQAKAKARSAEESEAALWYEWYEGFKGNIPGWRPPCASSPKEWESFMARKRPGGIKLGDFDDMLIIFRDILKSNPAVRKKVQSLYDHITCDEAQDLNTVQYEIIQMMSEHVGKGDKDKSLWLVFDPKQAIYGFRGANSNIVEGLLQDPSWNTKSIRTNYRCEPEIIDAANKLIRNNSGHIETSVPDPKKSPGKASIQVNVGQDSASIAISTVNDIKTKILPPNNETVSDFAILSRTNNELHSFETACIIRGIPYARKGASSFLGSPETSAVLSYVQLATGTDFSKMQKALKLVINSPNRFFVSPADADAAVEAAYNQYAFRTGKDIKSLNPSELLNNSQFASMLAEKLSKSTSGFKFDKTRQAIMSLGSKITEMRANCNEDGYTTKDLFDDILSLEGVEGVTDPNTGKTSWQPVTFRSTLSSQVKNSTGDDDGDAEEETEGDGSGLGNVSFLYELIKPDPTESSLDASKPLGFKAKMEVYASRARELRIDLNAWEKEQQTKPPEDRKPPPGIYIGTAHCSPGDEPILTNQGWVAIKDLDPTQHRLASYMKSCNQLMWGAQGATPQPGYAFLKDSRPYQGDIITILTEKSKTRVTPEHRILAKWHPSFMDKYLVYLMKRGDWWRVGVCTTASRPYRRAGLGGRLTCEGAQEGWVLKVFETKAEATLEEARIQTQYGIPGLTFEVSKDRAQSKEQLHAFHESMKDIVQPRALKLLKELGLDPRYPLYVRGGSNTEGEPKKNNYQISFVLRACNLIPKYMMVPVAPEAFVNKDRSYKIPGRTWPKPTFEQVLTGERSPIDEPVYSLKVVPHEYYVSGGAVVHNSTKGAEWKNVTCIMSKGTFPFEKRRKPTDPPPDPQEEQEELESERRLAYVALTRAAVNLQIVAPMVNAMNKPAGLSPFVAEAGLSGGENVKKASFNSEEIEPITYSHTEED